MNKVIFKTQAVTTDQAVRIETVQTSFAGMFATIDKYIPEGREKSLMITKLEEACMWGTKAISTEQVEGLEIIPKVRKCSMCGNEIIGGFYIDANTGGYRCSEGCLHKKEKIG